MSFRPQHGDRGSDSYDPTGPRAGVQSFRFKVKPGGYPRPPGAPV